MIEQFQRRLAVVLLPLLALLLSIPAQAGLPVIRGVGGDFVAMSTLGRPLDTRELRGKPILLFFGYTNCADVCPTTLAHLASLTQDAGMGDQVQVLFVSFDPEYDTPEHLAAYLAHFDERYIGISDRKEVIDGIVARYQAKYDRIGTQPLSTRYKKFKVNRTGVDANEDKAYLYSHTASIYLLDTRGRLRATYYTGTAIEQMVKDIQSLIAEASKETP